MVNNSKVEDHHAIIPTKSEHDLAKMSADEKKVYDLVARRFLAIFHPDAVFERTRIETTVAEHVFRTSGRVLLEAGWRSVYGQEVDAPDRPEDDSGGDQLLPKLELGEDVDMRRVESLRKETQPPRRFTEASLLGAMETAGKDIDDAGLREAMKDSGIGTPATRAVDHRAADLGGLHRPRGKGAPCDREGRPGDPHAGHARADVSRADGPVGAASRADRPRRGEPAVVHATTSWASRSETVEQLDALKEVKIERANLGPCPVCGKDVVENRKGYSCWSKEDPGCGFAIWKKKAGKILPASVVQELMESLRAVDRARRRAAHRPHRQAGDRLQGPLGAIRSARS